VERFRSAKPELNRHLTMRTMAPHAKASYEAREARLERLEAERRAKLAEKRKSITNKT
jgi:hypothetical protein